ncbi:MAG: hypothetical protein V4793_08780, partial [Paraburkholderia tropica]
MEGNEKPRSGMMARLRAWRGGFVEESEAATTLDPVEPVLGATRPGHAAHAARKGTGAPAGSLGAYLRDADVTDVDAFETADGSSGTKTPNDVAGDDGTDAGVRSGVPPAASLDDEASRFAMPENMACGLPVEAPSAEARAEARDDVREVARDEVRDEVRDDQREAADSAPRSEKLDEGSGCDHDEPHGHNRETPDEGKGEAQQRALAVSDIEYTPVGMPRLNSAQALADFKRVLCDTTPEATLRITPEARRAFVAVDMQAGMAVVIATREFHETALYATYVRDLERLHITVREEMVATADVIADVYERARIRLSKHVPESSRAIALFMDVIDAAQHYGSNDVHWESRDYLSDAEVRFRVDGDLYTYERMPKATILRALSAVY